jgi:predicted  nucleic acid-binding Zn-ribbon protein
MMAAGVLVAAFALAAGVYVVVPRLQAPQASVDAQAAREVEKARRLLDQFSENEERLATQLEALAQAGVDTQLSDELIGRMLNSDHRDFLTDEEERLRDVIGNDFAARSALDQRYREALKPEDQTPPVQPFRGFGANLPAMSEAIRAGRAGRAELLAANEKILAEALQIVNQALAITEDDVSSSSDLAANRLKGAILFDQGVGADRRADVSRAAAERSRRTLAAWAQRAEALQADTDLVQNSRVQEQLATAEQRGQELQQLLAQKQAEVDRLQSTADDLAARLAATRATADEARAALDRLEETGADLTDPDGMKKFVKEYTDRAAIYRDAVREAQALEFGTLRNARIDDSEDYLTGKYVAEGGPIEVERGLTAYQRDLASAQRELQVVQQQIDAHRDDVAALNELQQKYAAQAESARAELVELRRRASDLYTRLDKDLSEAAATEDDALKKLDQSVAAYKKAASVAMSRASEASTPPLSPEQESRSPRGLIQEDTWIQANIQFQQSAARLRQAMIYYDRFRDASVDAEWLPRVAELLELQPVNAEARAAQRDEAQEKGIEAATEASKLVESLGPRLQRHWTVPAQTADARYMLVLFGQEDLRTNVLDNYEVAVRGREDSPYVKAYQERLEMLRER